MESFEISGIPGDFSCEIFRFRDGRATVMAPVEDVTVQLLNPTTIPTTVPLSTAVESSISASGTATFRDGSDEHSIRVGIGIGLTDARSRIENRQPRGGEACSDQDDYTAQEVGSRELSASASCTIDTMNVVQGSVKTNAVGQAKVTEFEAEVISDIYIVMDHGRARTGRRIDRGGRYTLTIHSRYLFQATGAVTPPFSGCRIFPRNMHLMFHQPEFYLPAVAELVQLSPRSLSVSVVDAGQPVEGATVTMVSTQNAFPNGGVLPVSSQASGPTDASGLAKFRINPLGNEAFDQTDFTATTTINGETFTCDATVVAGLGVALNAYAARLSEISEMLEFSEEILGQVLAYLPERDAVSKEQLQKEIVALLQREVIGKPDVYRRLRDRLRRHRPAIQAYLEGGAASLDGEETADALAMLRFLLDHGGPELRKVAMSMAAAAPMLFAQAGAAPEEPSSAEAEALADGGVQAAFGRVPLAFEENVGQTHERIDYVARGPGYGVYLTSGEAILVRGGKARGQRGVVRMSVVGAGEDAPAIAEHPLLSKSHYLIGDDPANWHTDVPHAGRVRYRDVYPGIDLVYYGNRRRLEFDFDVAPGADPGQIKLAFPESNRVEVGEDGALLLAGAAYTVKLGRPIIYQETDGGRREIAGGYRLADDGSVGFRLGSYDPTQRLLIDPILEYSSYLGGIGEDTPAGVARDAAGNIYLGGTTASADFPLENPLQPGLAEGGFVLSDVFVSKFDPTGETLLYSTYLGGNSDDSAIGMAVDAQGSVVVTGLTSSPDFPLQQPVQPSYANGNDLFGSDAFVARLNGAGSALVYSTYLGGTGLDVGYKVALDAAGNALAVGMTTSQDLPILNALQPVHAGGSVQPADGWLAKFDPQGALTFLTYLGGSGDEVINDVALTADGQIVVVGHTTSTDFPLVSPFQDNHAGSQDAFAARIAADGQTISYSTYLGGASDDTALGVAVNGGGEIYLAGSTGSSDFPLQDPMQEAPGNGDGAGFDAFVTKLAADGATLAFSTYLGASSNDLAYGIAVGADGAVFVAGETESADFPVMQAFQTANAGGTDGFAVKLTPAGDALDYATYIGGSGNDAAVSIVVDGAGKAYVTGVTQSPDAPVTVGAFQTTTGGDGEGFLAILAPGTPPPVLTTVSAASFSGEFGAAPESIVSGFGEGLATGIVVAIDLPLPTSLAGTVVKITNSEGTEYLAQLFFVAPGQINYLIPKDVAPGLALVVVETNGQEVARGTLRINDVAPSLFAANANGQGVAAAVALRVAADGTQTSDLIFDGTAPEGSRAALPLKIRSQTFHIFSPRRLNDLGPWGPSNPQSVPYSGTGPRKRNLGGMTLVFPPLSATGSCLGGCERFYVSQFSRLNH